MTPGGELGTRAVPASAAGPSLRELVVGSEGVLGVICEATLRVRPAPGARRYEGWSFASFAEGCDAFRVMEQARRVAGREPPVRRGRDAAVAWRWRPPGAAPSGSGAPTCACAATRAAASRSSGFEGEEEDVERRRRAHGRRCCGPAAGVSLGHRPGEAWLRGRYRGPLPARRAARPRRDGGDARDRHHLGATWRASTPRSRDALRTSLSASAARRRS